MGKAEKKKADKFWRETYPFKRVNEMFQITGSETVERLCTHLKVNSGTGDNQRSFK
jgi:hypothetical protein